LPAKNDLYIGQPELEASQLKRALRRSQRTVANLQRKVNRLTPVEPYLIIDTSENLIFLKKGKRLIHQGVCSTGSYIMLKTVDGSEKWIFKTPRGMFKIQSKIEDPVWRMPDWAFIEEGLPVPEPDSHERFESGVLGDYALSLGEGYLIHGTLYQRFLGLPVTHGCVRLGDKELVIVYRSLKVGSKVFIY
jgi:L,D-transpeptidase YbiS